ncbi:hypothetical protein WDJ50_18600 (plasmid) [Deinococcus sp. VB142]|uniref:Uncharacterized protein n=1 Tax=Deinococcus sp. VB142 TaxID=3112952 RepID=A0AAU6Q7X6_9DEIO
MLVLAATARRQWRFTELREIGSVMREVRRLRDSALDERTKAALKLKRAPQGGDFDDLTRWYICASGQFELLPDSPAEIARLRGTWDGAGRAVGVMVPQFGPAWEPPVAERTVLHAPAPGSAAPEPGSAELVQVLRRGIQVRRASRRLPGHLNDEFEHYVVVGARTPRAAQREYWRHVANRACLAILADHRLPAVPARPSAPSTTPPTNPPRPPVGGDVFLVQAEAIQLTISGSLTQTQPLALEMVVNPEHLSLAARLSLQTLREWPTPQTIDPLFKYRRSTFGFERRAGLSGDMIMLFEELLRPHAAEMLWAMGLE